MLPGDVPLEMVRIPAGSFQMGSDDDASWSSWCYPCKQPVHTANINYVFYMGKYEVTQAQWAAVIGSNPSWDGGNPNHPVEQVSWDDIQNFVSALNMHLTDTGQGPATSRLPSEAEWEYACRAGTDTRFYFGDSDCALFGGSCELDDYAWWSANSGSNTH